MTGILLGLALLSGAAVGWSAVAICAGIFAVAVCLRGRGQFWTGALVFLALAGCLRVHDRDDVSIPDWVDGEQLLVGRVTSGPVESGRAQRFNLRVRLDSGDQEQSESAVVCASAPVLPALNYGDEIRL